MVATIVWGAIIALGFALPSVLNFITGAISPGTETGSSPDLLAGVLNFINGILGIVSSPGFITLMTLLLLFQVASWVLTFLGFGPKEKKLPPVKNYNFY